MESYPMRILAPIFLAPIFLVLAVTAAAADDITGIDWQLLAIDGVRVEAGVVATLRIAADGAITGKAPCNQWGSATRATLPALDLAGIRATRMACDKLAEEQAFFDALSVMTFVERVGETSLILTGPDGRTLEFTTDLTASPTPCLTCPPEE
jgi:heat shock protein HslJ